MGEDTGKQDVTSVTFQWARAGDTYVLQGERVVHKGGGVSPYRPVIGDLEMSPGGGKLFYEIRTNTDDCKIGVCTAEAFLAEEELQDVELGKKYTPSQPSDKLPPSPNCWVFNCQTSTVEVNGEEQRKLWRLFVPVSGARFGFLVNTDEGIVQLYVNDEYQGVLFDSSLDLKGKTLFPCIGLGGMDMHNRNIGFGIKSATVSPVKRFPANGM
ncbi:hypothetical protein LSM04_002499 [Trypanosoma melophagium]|uniref:uncharacterized protein n=1 Tax=Trypanosoma melophagium TaxID=715481 RepID=UPI00351A208E|nr:hypothetical protein LSM04_002499 [Trypanosoma melophagium]